MLEVNKNHKSFELKSHTNNKSKMALWKAAPFLLSMGMMLGLSGCGQKDLIKQIIAENKEYTDAYNNDTLEDLIKDDTDVSTHYLPVSNDFIDMLPVNLKSLNLTYENYISDMRSLPYRCPSLEYLCIEGCNSITDFEFVKNFKCLKGFAVVGECAGITQDLIDYLDTNGIEHNLTPKLVEINDNLDKIVEENVTDDMDDDEKLQSLTYYVVTHMKYDGAALHDNDLAREYNINTLSYALEGKGVCANYAAFLNALLAKAGVKSVMVTDDDHGWNLVQIEGKYYYVDPTNINKIPVISKLLLKYANKGLFYKQDPYTTGFSVMSDIDDTYVMAPENFLTLVKEAEDQKTFIEKYGSNVYADLVIALALCTTGAVIKRVLRR